MELLAPAGSYETLQAVIEAGADAAYIGGSRFGARAYADNPEEDVLLQAIDYAHLRGVKIYMTVNTLLTDRETGELYEYLKPYYEAGLDAVIVQDLGVLSFLRSHMPDLPIHLSTQMTVTDAEAATLFDEGVKRIVPARELSLSEIREMRRKCGLEMEIFVHGALCYSYSGQCLLSSLIGGRSGNRGRCAQPCRKEYSYEEDGFRGKGFLLSPKDQCLLPRLHELLETGIHSLKIEGRMKRAEYAAGVTSVYRKWIDRFYLLGPSAYRDYLTKHSGEMDEDVQLLAELYNRGGFCGGYVFDRKGQSMMCTERPNHSGVKVGTAVLKNGGRPVLQPSFTEKVGPGEVLEFRSKDGRLVFAEWTTPRDMEGYHFPPVPLNRKKEYGRMPANLQADIWRMKKEPLLDAIHEQYGVRRKPIPLHGIFAAALGEGMSFTVSGEDGAVSVTVNGEAPEPAKNAGADEASVREKLMKTGGTAYAFSKLDVFLGDGVFLPVSVLNRMRREALERYEEVYLADFRREKAGEDVLRANPSRNGEHAAKRVIANVMTREQTENALAAGILTDLYIDMEGDYGECLRCECTIPRRLVLPRVLKGELREKYCAEAERLVREYGLAGIVVRSMDQLAYARRRAIPFETDKTLYCMNSTAVEYFLGKGASAVTLSEELHRKELPRTENSILVVYGRSVAMVSEQCPRKTLGLCKKDGRDGVLTDGEGEHFPTKPVCRYCHSLLYNSHVMSLLSCFPEVPVTQLSGIRLDFTLEDGAETARVMDDLKTVYAGGTVSCGPEYTKGHWNRGVE